ncbi:MAG: hypothetical protein M1837_002130 [Sclerophora amabilis]|nr:MAG: hypothetical protein M1837_002130 [Sclerophora amabilis]
MPQADSSVSFESAGFPKASMESAIARGQGVSSSGAALESVVMEAILPPSIAVVIDCHTDSKARTLQDLRLIIKDYGGNVTPTGYLFEKKGRIVFEQDERRLGAEDVLDEAVEAGAEDVGVNGQGNIVIFTDASHTSSAALKLATSPLRLKVQSSSIIWDPKEDTRVMIDSEKAVEALCAFVEELRENSAVQDVYMNIARGDGIAEEVWIDLLDRLAIQ